MHATTQQPDTAISGGLLVVLGAVGFSVKPVLIKLAYADSTPVDAITLMTLRMLIALPLFLAAACWRDRAPTQRNGPGDWMALTLLGVMGYYLASLLDFTGLQYVSAGLERLILFLYPTFMVLFSALLYRRPIGSAQRLALLLSYLGIVLVYGNDPLAGSPDVNLGAALVLTSGIVFALYLTGSGHLIPRFGSRRFTAYSMSIAAVATVLHFAAFHPLQQLWVSADVFGLAMALAVFSTVLPAFLVNAGIRRIGADHASIITSVGPVMTLALAYLVLDESLGPVQVAGALLVLLGVMRVGLGKAAHRPAPNHREESQ